jgi:hypothetical protein
MIKRVSFAVAVMAVSLAGVTSAGASTHHKPKAKVHAVVKYRTRTITHTVDVAVTPAACGTAITDYAQEMSLQGQVERLAAQGIRDIPLASQAGEDESASELDAVTVDVDELNAQLTPLEAQASSLETQTAAAVSGCEG